MSPDIRQDIRQVTSNIETDQRGKLEVQIQKIIFCFTPSHLDIYKQH